MTETIAVLFIFFVLIVFGLMFYARYSKVAYEEKQRELLGSRAIEITLSALFMPELTCSLGEAEPEDNCFDMHKVRHIDELMQDHLTDYYFSLFSYATISIIEIQPDGEEVEYVLYDQQPNEWTRNEPTYFVVALRDLATTGEIVYNFGYLKVEVYQ